MDHRIVSIDAGNPEQQKDFILGHSCVVVLFEKEHSLQHQRWMRRWTELGSWRIWMMSPISSRESVSLGLWSIEHGKCEESRRSNPLPSSLLCTTWRAISSVRLPEESHLPSQCTYCSLSSLLGSLKKQTKKQLCLTGLVPLKYK